MVDNPFGFPSETGSHVNGGVKRNLHVRQCQPFQHFGSSQSMQILFNSARKEVTIGFLSLKSQGHELLNQRNPQNEAILPKRVLIEDRALRSPKFNSEVQGRPRCHQPDAAKTPKGRDHDQKITNSPAGSFRTPSRPQLAWPRYSIPSPMSFGLRYPNVPCLPPNQPSVSTL